MTKCRVPEGNIVCTNGVDTYHEWNIKYNGKCWHCNGRLLNLYIPEKKAWCEMEAVLLGIIIGLLLQILVKVW